MLSKSELLLNLVRIKLAGMVELVCPVALTCLQLFQTSREARSSNGVELPFCAGLGKKNGVDAGQKVAGSTKKVL